MRLRVMFQRRHRRGWSRKLKGEPNIPCDTQKLYDFIAYWPENEGWTPSAFLNILEKIGITEPQLFFHLNVEEGSFYCKTKTETVQIALCFGDEVEYCQEIWVRRGNRTDCYELWSDPKERSGFHIHKRAVTIHGQEKALHSYYEGDACCHEVCWGKQYSFYLQIAKSNDKRALHHADKVEAYLMDLEMPVSAQEVYEEVIKLLEYTEEDVRDCARILVAYREEDENSKKTTKSLVYKESGKMQEYGVLENGETFIVCRNGNWRYLSDTAEVYFEAEKNCCSVVVKKTTKDKPMHLQVSKVVEHVETKISQMWYFVK